MIFAAFSIEAPSFEACASRLLCHLFVTVVLHDIKGLKKSKKTPNILRIAARDKENLTSKISKEKSSLNINNKESENLIVKRIKKNDDLNNSECRIKKNNKIKKIIPKKSNSNITESDLTSDTPSENYWQKLAESYRTALDAALKENVNLHNSVNELSNKVNELEYENTRLKALHDEAKALVEVLTEMIEKNDDEIDEDDEEDEDNTSL
ncbi:Geminin, putative [Pediculus humanus corporis]|uniref:Geminin, putative n=1 Tax=Pediculus humanus subsp. corporis TaxID=121224 RepID=E0VPT7_PEDHC|nr:Geminin, putative [Pediculus humanus corporis]EEB15393.1 Geminin, putative [Pediculus humanus corporis]